MRVSILKIHLQDQSRTEPLLMSVIAQFVSFYHLNGNINNILTVDWSKAFTFPSLKQFCSGKTPEN